METKLFPKGLGVALIAIASLLLSCERDIDFNVKPFEPKIVVNSFIEADSLIAFHVSRSWTISEKLLSNRLYDAEVSLYVNDVLQPPLHSNHPDSAGYDLWQPAATHLSSSVARTGDNIRVVVRKEGYPEASAEVVVPERTPVMSIDTVRFYDPDAYTQPMRFLIRIKDLDPGEKNYYRLVVEREEYSGGQWQVFSVRYDYNQDAALSEGFRNVNDEILGTETENSYGIFTDDLFDGKEYTLNISLSPYAEFSSENHIRYLIKLVSLSPSAYLYLKSQIYHKPDDDFFKEPSVIYTNVRNGLGIVAAFQTYTVNMDVPVL